MTRTNRHALRALAACLLAGALQAGCLYSDVTENGICVTDLDCSGGWRCHPAPNPSDPNACVPPCTRDDACDDGATCEPWGDGTFCIQTSGADTTGTTSGATSGGQTTSGHTGGATTGSTTTSNGGSDSGNLCLRACERINTCAAQVCSEPAVNLDACVAHCEAEGILTAAPIIARPCEELNASLCDSGDFPECNCDADTAAWCLADCVTDDDCPGEQRCGALDPQAPTQCLGASDVVPSSAPHCGLDDACDEGSSCYRLAEDGDGRFSCVARCAVDADCEADQYCGDDLTCMHGGIEMSGVPVVPKGAAPCDVNKGCPDGMGCVETW